MLIIDQAQLNALASVRDARFLQRMRIFLRQHLPAHVEERQFDEVCGLARDLAGRIGATSEAQIVKIALIVIAVQNIPLSREQLDEAHICLMADDSSLNSRMQSAAKSLGLI